VYVVESYVYNFEDGLLVHGVRPRECFVSCMSAVNFIEKVIILTLLLWPGLIHGKDRDLFSVTSILAHHLVSFCGDSGLSTKSVIHFHLVLWCHVHMHGMVQRQLFMHITKSLLHLLPR
jgi:hypothetical protein